MGKDDEFKDLEDILDDDGKLEKDDALLDDDDEPEVDLKTLMDGIKDDDGEVDDDDNDPDPDDSPEGDDDNKDSEPDDNLSDVEDIVNKRVVEELNRIVPQRLARDRKTQQVVHLEQLTGMSLEQITNQVIKNMVDDEADKLGISEEDAKKIVQERLENASHKAEKTNKEQEDIEVNTAMKQIKYLQDKLDFAKKPKLTRVLTKDVVKEIDKFTQNGSILSFEDGMNYILGSKLSNGEMINKFQEGAAKKAQANMQQKRAVPQTKKTASGKVDSALTKDQRAVAINLGLTTKEDLEEYAREVNRENKRKQNRGR